MRRSIAAFLQSSSIRNWSLGLLLIIATIVAYQPVWHAGFIWQDDTYVTDNPLLTAPDGLWRIWFSLDSPSQYFPLTYTVFRVEHALWGFNPAGYHWVNILLHAINAVLVWRLLTRLEVPGAWLAAGIFALHPIQVQSVAWITELKNVLMVFFFLLALLGWIKYLRETSGCRWIFYGLTLSCYALALCAKTTACTLPVALLLILWLKETPITRGRVLEIAPFVALGIGMGLLTIWWERYHQGTHGNRFAMAWMDRILLASRAIWFYVGKLAWPADLMFSYPHWKISAGDPAAYLWLLATAVLGLIIYRMRYRLGRSVEVAVLFFVAMLAPLLGFVMLYTFLYSYVADHYQYVACIGLIALFSAGFTCLVGRSKRGGRSLEAVLGVGLLLLLGVLTWRQSRIYGDSETLWQTTMARNPGSWLAAYNLGTILAEKGEFKEGFTNLQRAVEINPDSALAQYNFGDILLYYDRLDEAIEHLQTANQLDPKQPLAHYKLANALIKKGQVDEGIAQFKQALDLDHNYADAHRYLGVVLLYTKGQTDQAIEQFRAALTANPEYPEAYNFLGIALLQKGHQSEAIANFQSAVELQPHYVLAENNLAWLLATSPDATVRNGLRAVELASDADQHSGGQDPMVLMTLAAAYAEAGRFSDAIAASERAIKLAQVQRNTGLAGSLQMQLRLYQAGSPFHMPGQTHASGPTAKP